MTQNQELPQWDSASVVYSKAYRVLESMATRGGVTPVKRKRGKISSACQISEDMKNLISALDSGDEETIKGLLLFTHVYK